MSDPSEKKRLSKRSLYVLLDGRSSEPEFKRTAIELIDAGVEILQLRDKRLSDRKLLQRARQLRDLTENTDILFIMNDRPDLAVLADADGVHLGQDELSVEDGRAIVGPARLVGVSTHSLDQARCAESEGADYIGVGPVFPSLTKTFDEHPGVDLLRRVAARVSIPMFAIGGICHENLSQVQAAGFTRVAVSNAILDASSPRDAAIAMLSALQN